MRFLSPLCWARPLKDKVADMMKSKGKLIALMSIAAIAGVGICLLLVNILERKTESKHTFFRVVEIGEMEDDPAVWGKNFPHQYDMYKRTVDQQRTRYGGSEAVPRTPDKADPRSVVSQSRIEEDPQLKRMWLGYAFSHDFREERGHAYMLEDQEYTKRQEYVSQPGACINCHASTYVPMMKAGNGDLMAGFHALNKLPYKEARGHVKHPVSCIDCHTPSTMQLRVTKPAFMVGIAEYKKSQGVQHYDVNKQATAQEMRTFVCAQCHVEYYFKGKEKTLTFPWSKGIKADQILSYYQENGHKDWVHAETQAPVLKAQHPEFELFSQGTHARAGVSCTDCHMPYERVGAMKITNHHVRSPMLNVNKSCQTCHHVPEDELKDRVQTIQERHLEMRKKAMDALMVFMDNIKIAQKNNMAKDRLDKALNYQREAQFLIDFIEAENSYGFHAPQEAARLIVQAMDRIREGEIVLRK